MRRTKGKAKNKAPHSALLLSTENSRRLDREAAEKWNFNEFALVEAAGRRCADTLFENCRGLFKEGLKITAAAGAGNNGADAMVMLRHWILSGRVKPEFSALVLSRSPKDDEKAPWAELSRSLEKMKVPVCLWGEDRCKSAESFFVESDIVIDGITGTGLSGPLRGAALEMASAINSADRPIIVSVDLPSGNFDGWKKGTAIIKADFTLAVEPQKICLYNPAARPYAGTIYPVGGIFPDGLIAAYKGAEILDWERQRKRIPKIKSEAYKNERGTVQIRAGSHGATGAAIIASRGAQAAGAGLVRLVADDDIYPILASACAGIMVASESSTESFDGRFKPDAILLGPGWGAKQTRMAVLEKALVQEKNGVPLVLDADAIELAAGKTFNGNAILTPHPLEFSRFSGLEKEEVLCSPAAPLLACAKKCNAVIIFKSHVPFIAAPDGRLGVLDGMKAVLASGGSGDLLAGFCAAIIARAIAAGAYDLYDCAAAAASLFLRAGRSKKLANRFFDPTELADIAADLAGRAWLPGSCQ